jgi:Domain of unknown function (DUF4214)/RTX calcium-binding nonapeptide repeat (4 copies)
MALSWLHRLVKKSRPASRPGRKKMGHGRFRPTVEALAERVLPAVTATFNGATGVLTVIGDELDNSLAVSRDAAGTLVVNGDAGIVPIQGGPATAANTRLIQIFGMGGNDNLTWSRSANLPPALVDGGAGDDTITSGTGDDTLVGGAGDDVYRLDTDTVAGSDTIDESGGGNDTLDFSSTTTRAVSINLGNPAAQVVNAGLTLTLSAGNTIENVIGGDLGDTLTGNGLSNVILGSGGNDRLSGAGDDDLLAGGAGDDTVVGNAGNDTFLWNPGDGNDFIDGVTNDGAGSDRPVFNGSDAAERIAISADGNAAAVTRDVDDVRLDLVDVETVDVNAGGGADTVTVDDLTGTGVTEIHLDLAGAVGGLTGDGQADTVLVNGTNGDDHINVAGNGVGAPGVNVTGLSALVSITNSDGPLDSLLVNGLGGNDAVDASGLAAGVIRPTVSGGAGNDNLIGSPGFDTFLWSPGDGSDTINGGAGLDRLVFDGSDAAEPFDLSANGTRVRLTRDVGGVAMDLGGVETITIDALGGADTVTVNDLTGTGVTGVGLILSGTIGGVAGDGAADAIIVNESNAADLIPVSGGGGIVFINANAVPGAPPYQIAITSTEGANDTLTVNALGGNDTVDASALVVGQIKLAVASGTGNDTIVGSQGGDTFVWNPGDGSDTIDGQAGLDKLAFNGSDVAENFVISRNGGHVRLTSDVGNVTMDLNAVDGIQLNARGGADTITVNDLTGTGLINVQVDLSGPAGGGDGQADSVILNGTNGNDAVRVGATVGGTVLVDGLSPAVNITGSDGVTDHLTVNTLGGNDTVDSTGLPAGLIGLTVNLGDGQPAAADATTRFVDRLYQDLLGRHAEPAGLAFWKGQLDQGLLTRAQVAAGIEASTEYLTDVVQQAYQRFLRRGAEPAGLNVWVAFLQQGHTLEQMQAGVLGSPEYFQVRGGGTNAGFLAALYQDALGRGLDASGQAAFGAALANGATPGQVAAVVLNSPEGRQDAVQGFYRQLLGRPADAAGLNGFVNALQQGATDQQVLAAIDGSDEFFANL